MLLVVGFNGFSAHLAGLLFSLACTDTHDLVHHVQHVHIAVLKHRAHLLLAELTDLQKLTKGFVGLGPPELLDDTA